MKLIEGPSKFGNAEEILRNNSALVARLNPAVVPIYVRKTKKTQSSQFTSSKHWVYRKLQEVIVL